ncbi:MAG: hypothetical protein ACYSWT_11435 [Planctomycetota bacterium]|jgi:hypothetical protein
MKKNRRIGLLRRHGAAALIALPGLWGPPPAAADVTPVYDLCGNPLSDLNADGSVEIQDVLLVVAAWGPCADCPEDLNGDGQVNGTDGATVLRHWGMARTPDDRRHLYQDLHISVFESARGVPTFTAVRDDGVILRDQFADEVFFVDRSGGAVTISYEIVEHCAGVDILYTVTNPSAEPRSVPDFTVQGVRQAAQGEVCLLNPEDSGTMEPLDLTQATFINRTYPGVYAPVIATHDDAFAVGSSLNYPYFDYRHGTRVSLRRIDEGAQAGTWQHWYLADTASTGEPQIPAGETHAYTVSMRFAPKRFWLMTLYPYQQFFQAYNGPGPADGPRDRRPIYKVNVTNRDHYDPDKNPRGYNKDLLIHTPPGWGPFVTSVVEDMTNRGFERFHLWLPSGMYHNGNGCNFPPQFMDFLPHLEDTDPFFALFGANGLELGFWWGRSTQVPVAPDPTGWDPLSCEPADYFDPAHLEFLSGQLQLALGRGADAIGLDAFVYMPAWQRDLWVDDMKAMAPDVLFIHEGSGPDFLHRKMANYYGPHRWGRVTQPGPDVLSRYLGNGNSAIWVAFRRPNEGKHSDYVYTQQDLQQHVRWGFSPILQGELDEFDIPSLDYTLVECFDGVDNDDDGTADFPYDPDCECAADDSEG